MKKKSDLVFIGNMFSKWDKNYVIKLGKKSSEYNNDKLLYLSQYRQGLWNVVRILNFMEFANKNETITQLIKTIYINFENKQREYLITTLLLRLKERENQIKFSQEEYDDLFKNFLISCKTLKYKEYLQRSVIRPIKSSETHRLIDINCDPIAFSKIVSHSKINYIDFWASWCAPCRAEMPDSKILRLEYKKKGINFIYISIDENPAAWERAVEQTGISQTESFLLPKRTKSVIAQQFKVTSIPRYLLIGEDGTIISSDAPRPSDLKIKGLFDQLLKK